MDNFREWISDNLRYILLVVAVIVVILLTVFGVKAVRGIAKSPGKNATETTESKKEDQKETKATEAVTEASTDVIVTETEAAGSLVQNDSRILTMMTSYYTAKTNKDMDTLGKLDPSIDREEELKNLEENSVESYSNIRTFSLDGAEEGAYVVYVCFDGKVKEIDTLVPSLTLFYLKTDTEGNLYIADYSEDEEAKELVAKTKDDREVQNLIQKVNDAYAAAKEADPVLKEFMDEYGDATSASQGGDVSSQEQAEVLGTEQTMYCIDACNVRSEPSTDGEIVGGLSYGMEVTVTGKAGDWYMIDFDGTTAYASADFIVSEEEYYGEAEGSGEDSQDEYYDDTYYDDSADDTE